MTSHAGVVEPDGDSAVRRGTMVIAALFGICVLTFAFYIPQLGFYWDDWPTAWIIRSDTYTVNDFFASDRPFVGIMYAAIIKVLPADPMVWQVLALLLRWWCAIAVWWIVRSVWRGREQMAFTVACLFLVYPGFTHQAIALTYSSLTFMLLMLLISVGASIQAIRRPNRRIAFTLVGVAALAVSLAAEYYLMLELLRVGFLYVVVSETTKGRRARQRRTFIACLPYLAVMGVYFVWRFVIFHPTRPGVGLLALTEFKISPVDSVIVTVQRVVATVADTGALAWAQPFNARVLDLAEGSSVGISLVLGFLACAVAWKTWDRLGARGARLAGKAAPPSANDRLVTRQILVLAGVGLLGAGIPAWLTARQVELGTTWDRYTLGGMLGAALLVVGTMRALQLTGRATVAVFAVMIGFSSAFLVQTASTYADDWASQRELFTQLQARIPHIKAGSSILLDPGPLIDARGYSMTATAADTMGYRLGAQGEMPFWIFVPEDFEKAPPTSTGLPPGGLPERNFTTRDDPAQFVVVAKPPTGCLRVLDPARPELWPASRIPLAEVPRSRPGSVIERPARRDMTEPSVFGDRAPDWCTAFETVDGALADGDLDRARSIAEDTMRRRLTPAAGEEWIPFAETFLRMGDTNRARELLDRAAAAPGTNRSLCAFADRVASNGPDGTDAEFDADAAAVASSVCQR